MSRRSDESVQPPPSVSVPGLSVVELVMAIEETFGLAIPDSDAERIVTVGDIKRYLRSRVRRDCSTDCASQRAFYRLRSVVCDELCVSPKVVQPRRRWLDVLPARGRRVAWKRIVRRARLPHRARWSLPVLRWNLPSFRNTVGWSARLLAASEPLPVKAPSEGWTRDEISRTVDRLVMDVCEITDFSDEVFLAD